MPEPPRHEPSDVSPLLPLWLAIGFAATVGGVMIAITLAFPLADRQQYRGPLQALPPAPQLQTAPRSDLERYRAQDRESARRTAIDQAMRKTAEEGWGNRR
jgi:hypothetical protein